MRLPSLSTIATIAPDQIAAEKLRRLLELFRDTRYPPRDKATAIAAFHAFITVEAPNARAWADTCYNRPNRLELTMRAADELLGTFGVEVIEHPRKTGRYGESAIVAEYCNTGDTYAPTLLYVYAAGTFRIGSWGDLVERWNL